MIIAIDGPAATGKSTSAKLVAQKLGFTYLDTGAMYRCVALSILRENIDLDDELSLSFLLDSLKIQFKKRKDVMVVLLNGEEVTSEIRKSKVTDYVSAVSAILLVRNSLVKNQREIANSQDCVVEGRDIGTVVFPNADAKFFLVADAQIRAQRRQKELLSIGENKSISKLLDEIQKRDKLDSERDNSPLRRASDAFNIDTTNMSINSQVDFIVNKVKLIIRGN